MLPLVLAAAAAAATAVPIGERPPPDDDVSPKVRAGVVVGFSVGGGVGAASGYPNDATKIGDPAYHSASGTMLGSSTSVLLMGALSDYLNFGFWFTHAVYQNGGWRSEGNGGGLRVDVFPFIVAAPRVGGLGLFGQFGIGGGNLASTTMGGGPGSSGTQSFIAAGGFYEWSFWRFAGGHFAAGPSLEYDAIFSQSFERHGLLATARLVFYGGP